MRSLLRADEQRRWPGAVGGAAGFNLNLMERVRGMTHGESWIEILGRSRPILGPAAAVYRYGPSPPQRRRYERFSDGVLVSTANTLNRNLKFLADFPIATFIAFSSAFTAFRQCYPALLHSV